MSLKVHEDEPPAGAPEWMVTFADLMSLLLTFFVLLLSFSSLEIIKFRTMAGSVRNAFGMHSEFDVMDRPMGARVMPVPAPAYSKTPTDAASRMTVVKLREILEKSRMEKQGNIEVTDRGVILRLPGDTVFDSGKAALKPEATPLLDRLAALASTSPGTIEVEGHTDDVPIRNARFPSNWELSAARAGSAVRYLTSRGVPASRLKAIGYADTRPLVPNDSAENRRKNRRVEFLFVKETTETRPSPMPAEPNPGSPS